MSRRKQGVPKKSGEGGEEEEANGDQGGADHQGGILIDTSPPFLSLVPSVAV